MSVEALSAQFVADFDTGTLIRVSNKQRPDLCGKSAGYLDNCGYVRVAFQGRKYLRSHIMFALYHGRFPASEIDHINRNRQDDRPANLREIGRHENMWNRNPTNRDLPMGVSPKDGGYQARIMCRRKRYHLGVFSTPEEAASAYQAKRKELYGEYA